MRHCIHYFSNTMLLRMDRVRSFKSCHTLKQQQFPTSTTFIKMATSQKATQCSYIDNAFCVTRVLRLNKLHKDSSFKIDY